MSADLFTKEGAPWAAFNLLRRRPSRLVRVGELVSCACGRTFIRTEPDPRADQDCQACRHDRSEAAGSARERAVRTSPQVAQFSRRKR
jgi:hypothetical protein